MRGKNPERNPLSSEDQALEKELEKGGACAQSSLRLNIPSEIIKLQQQMPDFADNVTVMPLAESASRWASELWKQGQELCRQCGLSRECLGFVNRNGYRAPVQDVFEERQRGRSVHPSVMGSNVVPVEFGKKQ